jgi:hypothetical protein
MKYILLLKRTFLGTTYGLIGRVIVQLFTCVLLDNTGGLLRFEWMSTSGPCTAGAQQELIGGFNLLLDYVETRLRSNLPVYVYKVPKIRDII